MVRILVTGGRGFIGQHLLQDLVNVGYNDLYSLSRIESSDSRHFKADITNKEEISQIISRINPDIIFHLAGITKGSKEELFNINAIGTKNILGSYDKKLILLSSGLVYQFNDPPFKEEMVSDPTDNYGQSKLQAEKLCLDRKKIVARASVVYGPRQTSSQFIPALIESIKSKTPFKTSKGEQTRDFIYVKDLTSALIKMINIDFTGVMNLGSGKEYKLLEVIKLAKHLFGKFEVNHIYDYKSEEVMRYVFDTSKAKQILNWEPQTNLREGLMHCFYDYNY